MSSPKGGFAANAHSILAGTYERFLFGHTFFPQNASSSSPSSSSSSGGSGAGSRNEGKTQFLCTIDAHQQSIKTVAAAGPFFCSGGHDDRIRAFHVNKRGEISDVGSLTGHTGTVTCIAFAKPGGGRFDGSDAKGEKHFNSKDTLGGGVPPPSRMLSGSDDGTILVWETYDFEILKKMLAHRNGVSGLSVHASGVVAVSCGKEDRSVALWDLKKGRVAYKGKTRGGSESGIDVFFSSKEEDSSGGGKRYGLLTNKWLDVIDCESGGEVSTFMREDQRESKIAYRKCLCATSKAESAENIYRVGYEGGDVCIFDARVDGGITNTIENAHENRVRCMAEIPERGGHSFATASSDGIIKVWDDRNTIKPIAQIEGGGRYTSLVVMDNNDAMRRSKPAKPKEIEIDDIEARLEMKKKEEKKASTETQKKAEKGKKKKRKKTKADYDKMDSDSELEIVNDTNANDINAANDSNVPHSDDEDEDEDSEDEEEAIEKMRQAYNKTHLKSKSKRKPQQSLNNQYTKNATTARKKANKKSKSKF